MYNTIKRLAEDKGMSIAAVCKAAGVSESALSMMKARGGKMSIDSALKVARVLGVTVEELLERKETEE